MCVNSRRLAASAFLAGFSALALQAVWARELTISLGASTGAVCGVLTLVMLGMGAGAAAFGRLFERTQTPGSLFGVLQSGCCLVALASLLFMDAAWGTAAAALTGAALAAGALPALARIAGARAAAWGGLYFWNLLGSACGAAATGFWFIPATGLRGALLGAAAAALIAAFVAPAAAARDLQAAPAGPSPAAGASRALWALYVAASLSGMGLELLWTRLVSLVFGSAAYSLALVQTAFLLGLAAGAAAGVALWPRLKRPAAFGLAQCAAAALTLAALAAFSEVPLAYLRLAAALGPDSLGFSAARAALALVLVGGPACCLGLSFPSFAALMSRDGRAVETGGWALAAGTLGAAAGPLAAHWLLIPALGLEGALAALAMLSAAVGVVALGLDRAPRARLALPWAAAALIAGFALRPPLSPAILHSGVGIYTSALIDGTVDRSFWKEFLDRRTLLYGRDGKSASVTVWKTPTGERSLVIDGKADASSGRGDMATQRLLGHLPRLLAPTVSQDDEVLVIGLGSGVTAAAAAAHPGRVEVAEIEPAVVEAAALFDDINHGVLRNPRMRLSVTDGRQLLRRSNRRYQAIISEPSNPWLAGMGHLFTEEFYKEGRAHLAKDGVFCQWLHLYEMTPEALAVGLRTFRAAFPSVSVWHLGQDLLIIGSERPVALDWDRLERRLTQPEVIRDLGLHVPDLLSLWLMDEGGIDAWIGRGPRHTDARPRLEYLAARGMGDGGLGPRNVQALDAAGIAVSPRVAAAAAHQRWLVRALLASGRMEGGFREFARLPAADRWHDGLESDLAELLLLRRDPRALALFEGRRQRRPADLGASLDLARAELALDRRAAAIQRLKRLADRAGEPARLALAPGTQDARLYLAMGLGYARLGDRNRAADSFSQVLTLEPALMETLMRGDRALR